MGSIAVWDDPDWQEICTTTDFPWRHCGLGRMHDPEHRLMSVFVNPSIVDLTIYSRISREGRYRVSPELGDGGFSLRSRGPAWARGKGRGGGDPDIIVREPERFGEYQLVGTEVREVSLQWEFSGPQGPENSYCMTFRRVPRTPWAFTLNRRERYNWSFRPT